MHCPQCSVELPDNARFCIQCGARLESAQEKATPIPKPKSSLHARLRNEFNNPSRYTIILGCGYFIFSLGCCLISLYLALPSLRPSSTDTSPANQVKVATDASPSTSATATTSIEIPPGNPSPSTQAVVATNAPPSTPTTESVPPQAPAPTDAPPSTSAPIPSPTETPTPMSSPIETASPQSPTILIIEVNKNDEYVEIANVGSEPQDLTGWVLLSENGDQTCTLGGVLDPEQILRIWALAEDAAEEGYNCGFDGNIWNDSETDLAILFDAMGQEVDRK